MLATIGRRPVAQAVLGLPIGMMLHLGVRRRRGTTPTCSGGRSGGWSFDDDRLPEVARGWWDVLLELVGLAVLVWVWRPSRLVRTPAARRQFLRDGRLFTERWRERCGTLSTVLILVRHGRTA